MGDQQLYEVEKILGKKLLPSRKVLYLVRWRGFSSDHDSWEPYGNLEACRPLINQFNKCVGEASSPSNIPSGEVIIIEDGKDNKSPKPKNVLKRLSKTPVSTKGSETKKQDKNSDVQSLKTKKSRLLGGDITFEIKQKYAMKAKRKSFNIKESKIDGYAKAPSKSSEGAFSLVLKDIASGGPPGNSSKFAGKKSNKRKVESEKNKTPNHSKAKKAKLSLGETKDNGIEEDASIENPEIISNDEGDDDDDNILYSLNPDCDTSDTVNTKKEKHKKDSKVKTTKTKKSDGTLKSHVISKQGSKSSSLIESSKKNVGKKKKRMSLMDSKKLSKDWPTKSGLYRSVSPPPLFTTVKHLMSNPDTQNPSEPSGNSLPDPVSPEASETYLADVPSSYPVPAEEPVANEQPLAPGSMSYKSLLDNLPEHFHHTHKASKKGKGESGSGDSSSTGSSSLVGASVTNSVGREPVERRTSVRSSECAFRYKQIVVKKCYRYTQIWLNTQTVMKNALNPQVIQEVVSALNSAKYDDSHLVLFSSLGNVFCSGTDLHFIVSGDRKISARQMADSIRELTKTFITFPKPIIAAVSGAAVGLGVSLLALCDVVYASDKASFHLPYSQLSQTPEGCSSFTLPLTLGLPSANELLYGGRKITAMEAYQLGLVSQVFWPTLMMQEVIPRAQNMATCSAKALEATKLLIRSHHRTKMELTNETECNLLLERWLSVDCQRAIEAYISNEKNLTF